VDDALFGAEPAQPSDDETRFAAEKMLLADANRAATEPGAADVFEFEALEAEATFDRVLFDGGEFGTQAAASAAQVQERIDRIRRWAVSRRSR
jgi:hypothetical protein